MLHRFNRYDERCNNEVDAIEDRIRPFLWEVPGPESLAMEPPQEIARRVTP